jgi:hypothetical protein
MAENTQLPPPGGPAGYYVAPVRPGLEPVRAGLVAALFIAGGVILGLLGGLIWAAAAPRVVYQVYTLSPPTAYALNPETSAFIAADGIYTFIALGGGALLGLVGYLAGVRRHGPAPLIGLVIGATAAAFLSKWLGTLLTGGQTFDARLATSKPGAILHAPITLGAHGALAFWPVAAALTAGLLELSSVLRARRLRHVAVREADGRRYGTPSQSAWLPPGSYRITGTEQHGPDYPAG